MKSKFPPLLIKTSPQKFFYLKKNSDRPVYCHIYIGYNSENLGGEDSVGEIT
jgi:hypothetical protein